MATRQLSLTPLLLAFAALAGCPSTAPNSPASTVVDTAESLAVTIKGRPFSLQLALDDKSRYQGYSECSYIPADGGMLFVFPSAKERSFVMRRCLVPIDIAFVGPGGRVVAVHAMQVEPPGTPEADLRDYPSGWPAQFAVEFAGGTIAQIGLKPGDKLDLPLASLKRRTR